MDKEEKAMICEERVAYGNLSSHNVERHAMVEFWLASRLPTWLIKLRLRMAKT